MLDNRQKVINKLCYKRNIFRLLEGFIHVVKCGGITGAAKKMCLSATVVSTQLAVLEQEFGVCLLKRKKGSKSMKLTEEGQLFYDAVSGIFIALEETIVNLHQDLVEYRNTLKVACHPLVSHVILIDVLQKLKEENPEIVISINEVSRNEALEQLKNGDIDVAIYPINYNNDMDSSLTFHKLWKYKAHLFCHKEHRLANVSNASITKEQIYGSDFVSAQNLGHIDSTPEQRIKIKMYVTFSSIINAILKMNCSSLTDINLTKLFPENSLNNISIKYLPHICSNVYFSIVIKRNRYLKNDYITSLSRLMDLYVQQLGVADL